MKTNINNNINNNKNRINKTRVVLAALLVAIVAVATILFALPACENFSEANAATTINSAVAQLIADTAAAQDVPGISVAIVDNGTTRFYSHGYIKAGNGVAVNEHTSFGLGSVSKAFTALTMLYLDYSNEFNFNITDSLQTHIDWLNFNYSANDFNMHEITIKNLVHHTSGITNDAHSLRLPPSSGENAAYTIVQKLNGATLQFRPGSRYEYGSSNYIILGLVVQNVTGMSFEQFLQQRILAPLGLHNTTTCVQSATANGGTMASAHSQTWFSSRAFTPPLFTAHIPTGFINSTASDMALWLNLQLNSQLAPAPFDYLIQNSQTANTSVAAFDGEIFGMRHNYYYSAGWMISACKAHIVHLGESPGFLSAALVLPQSDKAIIILKNSSSGDVANLMYNITDYLQYGTIGDISTGSEFRLFDTLFAMIAIAMAAIAMTLLIAIIVSLKNHSKNSNRKNVVQTQKLKSRAPKIIGLFVALIFTALATCLMLIFPALFNVGTWAIANLWISQTVLIGFAATIVVGVLAVVLAVVRIVR